MISNQQVIDLINKEVEESNKTLAHYETIKRVTLMPAEWTIENGEMTPKLSLKRKVILEANKAMIERLFRD